MNQQPVTSQDIRDAIRSLNLSNRPLCVHSSLRSFGRLEDGAATIIEALLSEGCTIVVPSFTDEFEVPPPANRRLLRNGYDYDAAVQPQSATLRWYSPESQAINRDMGALPAAIVATPGRQRGDHPLNSFSAIGPMAAKLIEGQRPLKVYAPLTALAEADGWVLLMGVGLDRLTLIHAAEEHAGRTLFRCWSRDRDGQIVESQIGSCSAGFERLGEALAPLERNIDVGSSRWRAYPAAELVELAAQTIRNDPSITRCDNPNCRYCRDAILGGPIGTESLPYGRNAPVGTDECR
jgi:aminoglycoside N3'-acetyltransferase